MPQSEVNDQPLPKKQPARTEGQVMAVSQRLFPITSHALVECVQKGEAAAREMSLASFCTIYYPAIYGFARMRGLTVEDAQDRTQDFFVEVVRDNLLSKFDPKHGSRLSSWLMTCFKHLELNHREAQSAKKRGGGQEFVSFDTDFAEQCHHLVVSSQLSEVSGQDFTLALSFWRSAELRLRGRYLGTPNERLVHDLLPLVLLAQWPKPPEPSQEDMAKRHGTTPVRLKAFFNRTLKSQAQRLFIEEVELANPGINKQEIDVLWLLLRQHAAR